MPGQTLPSSPADRIVLLLNHSAVSRTELAKVLGLPAAQSVDAVLAGERELSPSDLVAVADLFDVPVTVLSGHVPLERHLGVSLRLGAVQAPEVPEEALQYADRLLRYRYLLDSWLGVPRSPLDGIDMSVNKFAKEAGKVSAQRVRDGLALGEEPVSDLVGLCEQLGFPVAFQRLPAQVHGLNVQDAREGTVTRLILVSTRGPWTQQRYTLAHELCHALYDDEGQVIVDFVDVPDVLPELRAEAFARHLLLPATALRREVTQARREGAPWPVVTARLMVRWGISRRAVLRALLDDQLADRAVAEDLESRRVLDLMAAAGLERQWHELSEGEAEPSGSPILVSRALEAYRLGRVSARVVADLLDQDLEETRQELAAQGWSDPEAAPLG